MIRTVKSPLIFRAAGLRLAIASLLAVPLLMAGCRAKQVPQPADRTHIQNLARAYLAFQSRENGKGSSPANEEEFKQFIRTQLQKRLADKLGDVEAAFTSPRDGKPYSVAYGERQVGSVGSAPVIIHEEVGRDGLRLVAYATSKVEELDDARFQQVVPKK